MEDLPLSLLTQQENAKPKTGEDLETFGKHAASLHLDRGKTLNEAVVETVKSAGLSPEQVQRVVEFANTNAYLKKFAGAGPDHKVVEFAGGPASFPEVIRDLNDGGGGSLNDPAPRSSDYDLPPPDVGKLAAANESFLGLDDSKLAAAFGVTEPEVPLPYEEPLQEALAVRDKLASLYDEANSELEGAETRNYDLCNLLFHEVKQASLSGASLGHVVAAMSTANDDPEFMKSAFAMLAPRLIDNGVFQSFETFSDSLEKTAGAGTVNGDHPLLGIYSDYCDTLSKMAALRQVKGELEDQLDSMTNFLHIAQVKMASAGKIPQAWRAVTQAAEKASKHTGRLGEYLGGERAGKALELSTKYAPQAVAGTGALLATEEGYQRAKHSPTLRFVKGRIPGTQENKIRQYHLAQR